MFVVLDMIYVRSVEKSFDFKFSQSQIEDARANEGHVAVRIDGRYKHFCIPLVKLKDLLTNHYEQVEPESPW